MKSIPRLQAKSFIGILIAIPFIFFLIYSGPSHISADAGGNGGGGGGDYTDGSSLSNSDNNNNNPPPKLPNVSSLSPSEISMNESQKSNSNSDDLQQQDLSQSHNKIDSSVLKCICDNNSNNNKPFSATTLQFTPGQAVHDPDRIIIFLITPTYTRPTQMADMTRLAQTIRLVPDVFWIVVEDSHNISKNVADLLLRSHVPYAHLLGPRPLTHMDKRSGRGVSNRLKAFEWLRENYGNTNQKGVLYFADDDNSYDVRLFDEIRDTKVVSMFPVGLIGALGLSTPIVSEKTGKIIGFHDPFIGRRKFAVDMAGFAVNLQLFLKKKKATMPYKVGYEEDYFLKSLEVKIWQLEPKAQNCTKIYVWHTKTKPGDSPKLSMLKKVTNYTRTNLPLLYYNENAI